MVNAPNFDSQGFGFKSYWRQNSAHGCMALLCTEPFIITLKSSRYDLNNVERDIKHQTIMCSLITLHPLYNTVRYNTVLDITYFKDESQKCIDSIEK